MQFMPIPAGLQRAFDNENLILTQAEGFFLTDGTTGSKVHEIIVKAKYLPIFRSEHLNDKYAFVVVPFRNPEVLEVSSAFSFCYRECNVTTAEYTKNKCYLPEDHYANNREEIEHLLKEQGDTIKTAVILGPGNCDDIPLERIVSHCAHVTMMEIDVKTLKESIQKLPPDLQKKVETKICDLNGILDYFLTRFYQIPSELSAEEAREYFFKIVEESMDHANSPPVPGKFDLVVSSMVANQLFWQSQHFLKEAFQAKVRKEEFASFKAKVPLKYNDWITNNHFQHMKTMTNEEGFIYFSDQIYYLDTHYEGKDLVPEKEKNECHEAWLMSFLKRLTPLSKKQWLWDRELPMQNPETGVVEPGVRMEVHAYVYKPWETK